MKMYLHEMSLIQSLQWRHDERDGVSIHQRLDCLLYRLLRHRSKKTSKLQVTGLRAGNWPVTGEFPTQNASDVENVAIWWRHNAYTVTSHRSVCVTTRPTSWPLPSPLAELVRALARNSESTISPRFESLPGRFSNAYSQYKPQSPEDQQLVNCFWAMLQRRCEFQFMCVLVSCLSAKGLSGYCERQDTVRNRGLS